MTMVHGAKVQAAPEPTALSTGLTQVAGGGFTRLNPVDGLFLRAEHLKLMQQYTTDLAAAVGAGLGPGVAYGYTCTLTDNVTVEVSGGLAFADGHPLRSTETASISLEDLTASDLDFWIIEIVSKIWQVGSEPVYGGLCEDPCGKGSGIRPNEAVGIELRLRHDSLDKPAETTILRRNRLASFYFERERRYGGEFEPSSNAPWLMPVSAGGPVLNIKSQPWGQGTGPHDYAAVPLGVVWKQGNQWKLDTWTARRDLGDPTPVAAWQWRLAWRTRNVFVAQVLQFQDQLAASSFSSTVALPDDLKALKAEAERAFGYLAQFVGYARNPVAAKDLQAASDSFDVLLADAVFSSQEVGSLLRAAGLSEVPPAGYLPFEPGTQEDMEARAANIFGPNVDVQVRVCRADYIAHAVEQVQHMDRIPLDAPRQVVPTIDLLVPERDLVDLNATWPGTDYRWAAFVRRREEVIEQPRDEVDVYGIFVTPGEGSLALGRNPTDWPIDQSGRLSTENLNKILGDKSCKHYGVISYPAREWGVPVDATNNTSVWEQVHADLGTNNTCLFAVGLALSPDRQSLAAVRTSLLVAPERPALVPVRLPTTSAAVVPTGWQRELIFVVIGPRPALRENK